MKRNCHVILFSVFFAILVAFMFISSSLNAEENEPGNSEYQKPRTFALGISTLKEHGFGCVMRLRFNHFALDGIAGFMPLMLIIEEQYNGSTNTDFKFGMPLHVSGGAVIFFNDQLSRFQNGLRGAIVYDKGLGNGYTFGWVGDITWDRFALCIGAGLQYYPDPEEKVREYFDLHPEYDLSGSKYQPYIGVNFIWYLFNCFLNQLLHYQ